MRALLLPLMLVAALTACGEARTAESGAAAAEIAEFTGRFKPAHAGGGADILVERAGLVFDDGAALYTRRIGPRAGLDLIAADGRAYAALAAEPGEVHVDLRRVIDATSARFCDGEAPAYLALIRGARGRLTLALFAGGAAGTERNAKPALFCAALHRAARRAHADRRCALVINRGGGKAWSARPVHNIRRRRGFAYAIGAC